MAIAISQVQSGAPWGAGDEAELRDLATTMPTREIAALMHRTVRGIQKKASKLQISLAVSASGPHSLWSAAEDEKLKSLAGTMSARAIGRLMGRSHPAVIDHACILGVSMLFHREPRSEWRIDELRALIDKGLPAPKIAARMGLPISTIRGRVNRLGLKYKGDGRRSAVRNPNEKPRTGHQKLKPAQPVRLKVARITASSLAYCQHCHAPVVNTAEGWAAHNARIHRRVA